MKDSTVKIKESTAVAYQKILARLAQEGADFVFLGNEEDGLCNCMKVSDREGIYRWQKNSRDFLLLAAGTALCGKTVFMSESISPFIAVEGYEQIRTAIALPGLRVRIAAAHDSKEQAQSGALYQMIEDLALMRVMPNMIILVPSDIICLENILHLLLKSPLPAYIRLSYLSVEPIYNDEDSDFAIGGARLLLEGESVTLCACGIMVREALEAANILKLQGIHAEVIDCYSIKPFPEEILLSSIRRTGCCVVAEKHSKIGGLYGAVTECVSRLYPVPVRYVAIEDHFGQSGTVEELREYYGLTHREIVHNAVQVLAMRRR